MKILIVDDNAEMRALVRRFCETLATQTCECANGSEAIQVFREFQPDWTIMDLAMPGLDGLAATRQILAAHPGARIIMLTQHSGPEYEEAAHAAGACAFLTKDNLQSLLPFLSQNLNTNKESE